MKRLVKKQKKNDSRKVVLYRNENTNGNCNNSGSNNSNTNCKCGSCK